MCDYSLELYRRRPAQTGERYEIIRFPSGSKGFASPGNCTIAVCMPYETRLRLSGIPANLQQFLNVHESEEVTFVELDAGHYRDGVKFENGKVLSLQVLSTGISANIAETLERPLPEVASLEIERVG